MNQAEVRRRQVGALSEILMMITIFVIGNMIGNNGIVYVAVGVELCALAGGLINGGVSDILGKLLRRRRKKGQYKNAHKMRKTAILFQLVVSAVLSIVLFGAARFLGENLIQIKYCTLILRVLSPIVFLRAVTVVLLGFCQGEGLELPAAIIGILRQFLTLIFSFLFADKLTAYGFKVGSLLMQHNFRGMYSGLAVAVSILMAELLCIVFLVLIYKAASAAVKKDRQEGMQSMDSYVDCIRGIWLGRWPLAFAESLLSLPFLVAIIFLNRSIGEDALNVVYGPFLGKYMVICGVWIALIMILVLPAIGRTFAFIRKEDKRYAKTTFGAGVHICIVHGIFLSVFIAAMAPQIAGIFGGTNVELLEKLLSMASFAILVGVLCRYFGRFLTAAGKWLPMFLAILAAVVVSCVYIILTTILREGTIWNLVFGILIGFGILTILLGLFSHKVMRARMEWVRMFLIPLGAGVAAGLSAFGLGKVFTPHLGNGMTLFVAFIFATLVYWVILLVFRNFKEQELDVIAGGRLIHNLGQMLRVY